MSANLAPIFTLTPDPGCVNISTANTARDGTGTLGTAVTAGTNGTLISAVYGVAQVTTAAGMIRLFLYSGSTYYLFEELPTAAVTPSGTLPAATVKSAKITPSTPLALPSGWSLQVSTNNAETWSIAAPSGKF